MLRPAALAAVLALAAGAAAPEATAQTRVTWETLAQVRVQNQRPQFGAPIQRLNGQRVTIYGFMMPLDQAARQQRFLLTSVPMADCFYCLPGGPETMIEIRAAQPVGFSYNRIAVTGQLELLTNDAMGMYYRITNARVSTG